jgi:hypothetical protein
VEDEQLARSFASPFRIAQKARMSRTSPYALIRKSDDFQAHLTGSGALVRQGRNDSHMEVHDMSRNHYPW